MRSSWATVRLLLPAAPLASFLLLTSFILLPARTAAADETLPSVDKRFTPADGDEAPSFQRHVVPLFGRLGCNGRACHGSFQGQGGFRLSLFGYDFKSDHEALASGDEPRVDTEEPDASLIIAKPSDEDIHDGGKRFEIGSWQHHVIQRWIAAGAKHDANAVEQLNRLEIEPSELRFSGAEQSVQLKAVAVWEDGTREDVTPLCRFQTSNEQIAAVDEDGMVTSNEAGDTHLVVSYDNAVVPVPVLHPVTELVGNRYPQVETPTEIDRLVVDKLKKLGIVPSELADDAQFLRRVRLDLTGTLPSAREVEKFLADQSPNKRISKVESLLKTPAYAAWWTTKLCDFTGNNSDALANTSPVRGRPTQDWYDWIFERVADNAPYDELAAGIVTATSRRSGQTYTDYCEEMSRLYAKDSDERFADRDSMPYYWARRDLLKPEERAIGFAYSFLGIRIQCAQCHKHPFDQWSKDDFDQFKNFFASVSRGNRQRTDGETKKQYDALVSKLGVKETRGNALRREFGKLLNEGKVVPFPEVYVDQPRAPATGKNAQRRNRGRGNLPVSAKLLGGDVIDLTKCEDPRTALMEWLRGPENPYFARAFVNRVWASYFNVGIVEPADDMSLANPPSNKPLLDYLARGFIDSGFDMKWVHREILNSQTYQRSWKPNETNAADEVNFSRAIPRRLPAEVAYDALQQATASDDAATALHDDIADRAIAIPGVGRRNARAGAGYALTIFGRSTRESNCDCDRSMEASLLQTVYLQNDQEVLQLLDRRDGWVAQVTDQLKADASAKRVEIPARVRTQVSQMQKRLRQLQRTGKEDAAKKIQQRLALLRRRFRDQAQRQPVKIDRDKLDGEEIAKQAYLRTLSRYPNKEELARSSDFVTEEDDTISAVRDLMWALINTKEFIVNH